MRLGLIADIHADHRALDSALRHLDRLRVSTILCAGDIVGYGTHADEVVELLRARTIPCVRGNHDRWALERRQVIGLRGWKNAGFRDATWEFLAALPPSLKVTLEGRRLTLFHGSPDNDMEYVTPYKPMPGSVDRFWEENRDEILVLGHTHITMVHRTPQGTVLNPGSVLGVPGVQTSYSFAVVELDDLAVRWYEIRTGRELRRDPIFMDEP
jgi:putative phosphoesterase